MLDKEEAARLIMQELRKQLVQQYPVLLEVQNLPVNHPLVKEHNLEAEWLRSLQTAELPFLNATKVSEHLVMLRGLLARKPNQVDMRAALFH